MLKEIKSFLKPDMPTVPLAPKKVESKPLPLILGLDYCNRFRPLFDRQTFASELEDTGGELADYFEPNLKKHFRSFTDSGQYVIYGTWGMSLLLALYCHKLRFVNRLLGEKTWKMFSFKLTCLVIPYYFMDSFMEEAKKEETSFLYSKMSNQYRRFKLSGDITQLNSKIEEIDEPSFTKGGGSL